MYWVSKTGIDRQHDGAIQCVRDRGYPKTRLLPRHRWFGPSAKAASRRIHGSARRRDNRFFFTDNENKKVRLDNQLDLTR